MKDNLELLVRAICSIIDHFFTRREQHVEVVLDKTNANINKVFNDVLEHGPAYFEKVEAMIDSTFKKDVPPTEGESNEDLPN